MVPSTRGSRSLVRRASIHPSRRHSSRSISNMEADPLYHVKQLFYQGECTLHLLFISWLTLACSLVPRFVILSDDKRHHSSLTPRSLYFRSLRISSHTFRRSFITSPCPLYCTLSSCAFVSISLICSCCPRTLPFTLTRTSFCTCS